MAGEIGRKRYAIAVLSWHIYAADYCFTSSICSVYSQDFCLVTAGVLQKVGNL